MIEERIALGCFISLLLGIVLSAAGLMLFIQYFPLSPSAWHWGNGGREIALFLVLASIVFVFSIEQRLQYWIKVGDEGGLAH